MDNLSLYFAYGSNLDSDQMRDRCPGSTEVGIARLLDYEFRINSRGVATVVRQGGRSVIGLLWAVSGFHLAALDRFEGVARGLYRRVLESVERTDGKSQAYVYVAADEVIGKPRPGYLERIIEVADARGFPVDYLTELTTWARPADSAT